MSNTWRDDVFDSLVRLKRGHDLPNQNIVEGKFPIVASSGIKDFHNDYKAEPPIVVTGRSGTLGEVQYITQKSWPLNTTLYSIDFKGNYPKYVYYYLKEMHLENFNAGAGVPTLNQNHLQKLKIKIPSIEAQQKIAAILSTYDDLIENNKQRIKLLENMAEELYKEWFVRFRFPNWQNTEFEKGIPKGWQGVRFDSLCRFKKGSNPDQVLDFLDEDMAMYINMESLTGEGRSYAKKQKNSVECQRGDLLMLMDGSRSGLVFKTNNSGIVGSTLSIIQVDDNKKNYVFEYLKAARSEIVSNNTGSAIPHANKDYINRMIIFVPNDESIILKFNQLYCGKYALIENLQQQIKQLEKTKNSLLPRLISGKLSVQHLNIHYPPSMQ